MQAALKKIQSNSGASLVMALLLILVGVMVSAVIIAAAVSSVQAQNQSRDEQQLYLEVSSAAELVRDELESDECDCSSEVTNVYTKRNSSKNWGDPSTTTKKKYGTGALFSSVIEEALEYAETYTGSTFSKTYSIDAGDYNKVTAEVLLNKKTENDGEKYNLTITFASEKDEHKCRMILTADGIVTTNTTDTTDDYWSWGIKYNRKTEVITTTIDWQNTKLQRKEVQ